MFIKGYTVPGVRLDLGLTQDTGGDSSKGWTTQYVMGVIKRIQENQFIKESFLSVYVVYLRFIKFFLL